MEEKQDPMVNHVTENEKYILTVYMTRSIFLIFSMLSRMFS